MNKLSVGIIFGSNSTEYEVSLVSASSVIRNIDRDRFDVVMIGISRDGRWFSYFGDVDSIENGILVCRFSGGDPATNGDFSGVAKNSFYIKKIKYFLSHLEKLP